MSIDGCIAMWEGVIQALKRVWHTMITVLIVVAYVFSFVVLPFTLPANANDWTERLTDQAIPTYVTDQGVILPDWGQINLSSLPGFLQGGSVQFPPEIIQQLGFDPSMVWNAGDSIQDVLKMGMIQDLGIGDLDLSQINQIMGQTGQMGNVIGGFANGNVDINGVVDMLDMAGVNVGSLTDLPLEAFSLAGSQSITQLAEIVPNLGSQIVGDVAPIASLVAQAIQNPTGVVTQQLTSLINEQLGGMLGNTPLGGLMNGDIMGVIQNLSIDTLVSRLPDIAGLALDNIDLSSFAIGTIPGLDQVPLLQFEGWEGGVLSAVPGLAEIPFDKFPNPLKEGTTPLIARVDVPLDDAEQSRERSLSGSFQEGFRVPCDANCTHAELTPVNGSPGSSETPTAGPDGFINGRSWMSGKAQEVSGGYGVLAVVNGGKEPTGRNPYGGMFKQVIWDVDQVAGKVQTTMWFRYCQHGMPDLGCTPYFLGPVPFITYPEMMHIYLGLANPEDDGRGLSRYHQNDPLSGQDGFVPECGTVMTGDAVDRAIAASTYPDRAREHIPRILAALQQHGITDPHQVAYVLATAEHETDHFNSMKEYDGEEQARRRGYSGGINYYGRGYVMITHDTNYQRMGNRLGVDLLNNPEMAMDPNVAAQAIAIGMRDGMYTGVGLSDFINGNRVDFVGARAIVNGSDDARLIAGYAQDYLQAIATVDLSQADIQDTCANNPGGGDAPSGEINQQIMDTINQMEGFTTSDIPGTEGGQLACAAAVNEVLCNAGVDPMGGGCPNGGLSVDSIEQALKNGRGQQIPIDQAQPGDIVIVRDSGRRRHVGFCTSAGCTQQISNSSSRGRFSWRSNGHPPFRDSYNGNYVAVYRITN